MNLPSLSQIEAAAQVVYREFQATPQYHWALLSQRLGSDCWVKHENHTPVGAFKIRGGLTYFEHLEQTGALPTAVISATRGNHGQSIGWAARAHGIPCHIVVPLGNSLEKNAAMRTLGVTLIEHGADFQESREHARALATQTGAHMVPSFHPALLSGVSTYWWEFFKAVPDLDVVYVPIGQGSGACAAIAAKRALGHKARIVGVVSAHATTYADSFAAGCVVESPVSTQPVDGMACRVADQDALNIMLPYLDHRPGHGCRGGPSHARPLYRHPQRGRRRWRRQLCRRHAGTTPDARARGRYHVERGQCGRRRAGTSAAK
jgi:threonine dehydratase